MISKIKLLLFFLIQFPIHIIAVEIDLQVQNECELLIKDFQDYELEFNLNSNYYNRQCLLEVIHKIEQLKKSDEYNKYFVLKIDFDKIEKFKKQIFIANIKQSIINNKSKIYNIGILSLVTFLIIKKRHYINYMLMSDTLESKVISIAITIALYKILEKPIHNFIDYVQDFFSN